MRIGNVRVPLPTLSQRANRRKCPFQQSTISETYLDTVCANIFLSVKGRNISIGGNSDFTRLDSDATNAFYRIFVRKLLVPYVDLQYRTSCTVQLVPVPNTIPVCTYYSASFGCAILAAAEPVQGTVLWEQKCFVLIFCLLNPYRLPIFFLFNLCYFSVFFNVHLGHKRKSAKIYGSSRLTESTVVVHIMVDSFWKARDL